MEETRITSIQAMVIATNTRRSGVWSKNNGTARGMDRGPFLRPNPRLRKVFLDA
jgi:hypothetical protein